jgi:DNA primase
MAQNEKLQPGQQAAADTPQPPMLAPDQAVEQLQALLAQVPVEQSLTSQERKALRRSLRLSDTVVQASFSVIDASDTLSNSVAKPDEARQLVGDSNLWTTFENELRGALQRVADANIVRRQRARLIASQAYAMGQQLARNPENAGLKPHVQEVKRLRSIARRKKTATPAPQTPAPSPDAPTATGTSPVTDASTTQEK